MKKVAALFVPVLMMMASCSKTITITGNDLKTDVFYAADDVRPFTGVCRIYYPGTSNIKEEFTYRKGRMEGNFTSYFNDGSVKRKGNYSNGLLSGTLREWDTEGNLLLEARYVNDTLEGQFMRKNSEGNIIESGIYSANKRTGEWPGN